MRSFGKLGVVLLVLMALASCGQSKLTDIESLRSQFRSAMSLASEADLFVNFVRNGQATVNYAAGHAKQLAELIQQSESELKQMAEAPAAPAAVRTCNDSLESLRREVLEIPNSLGKPPALQDRERTILEIQRQLKQASASL